MKKIVLVLLLVFSTSAHAGLLSFLGDVASISSVMGGASSVSHSDLKKVNAYLWSMVEAKRYDNGYELLAEVLEVSSDIAYIDTAAQAYYDNGKKEKALELYELKVIPIGRALGSSYEATYRKMKGIDANGQINYDYIYKKQQEYKAELADKLSANSGGSPVDYAIWGIFLILLLNLYANRKQFFESFKS